MPHDTRVGMDALRTPGYKPNTSVRTSRNSNVRNIAYGAAAATAMWFATVYGVDFSRWNLATELPHETRAGETAQQYAKCEGITTDGEISRYIQSARNANDFLIQVSYPSGKVVTKVIEPDGFVHSGYKILLKDINRDGKVGCE